jgi:transketolase
LQATDTTEKVFPIRNLKEKWASFGWHVVEIDGHNVEEILNALDEAKRTSGSPTMIIARTVKGKGFSFAEGVVKFHNGAMTEEEHRQALEAIKKMREAL